MNNLAAYCTGKFFLGLAAGLVIGAVGYKMVSEQKLNPQELQKTVMGIAGKFKKKDKPEEEASAE